MRWWRNGPLSPTPSQHQLPVLINTATSPGVAVDITLPRCRSAYLKPESNQKDRSHCSFRFFFTGETAIDMPSVRPVVFAQNQLRIDVTLFPKLLSKSYRHIHPTNMAFYAAKTTLLIVRFLRIKYPCWCCCVFSPYSPRG